MIYRYARACYLERGGNPADLDDMPWSAVIDWLTIQDLLEARSSLGGLPEDS